MKVGIGVKNYERYGENRYKKLKEFGYECVDYGLAGTETEVYRCDEDTLKEMLGREKMLAKEAGLSVHQTHGPWRWPPQDRTKEEQEERMEKMKKCILATALLDCKYMVIHPMMPYGIEERDTEFAQKTWDFNLEYMRELLKCAKEHDVVICIENMPMGRFSMGSPRKVYEFVKEMNDTHLKMCLDTGHAAIYDRGNPAEAVREFGDEIRVIHVHDNDGYRDLHQMPYQGIIDWKEFGCALRESGFQGVFNYETAPDSELPDAKYEQSSRKLAEIAKELVNRS